MTDVAGGDVIAGRQLTTVLLLLILSGCAWLGPRDQPPAPNEISSHPSLLYTRAQPIESWSLRGVRLGDSQNAISDRRIHRRAEGGWIWCRDGSRYRVEDGRVVTLGVWDHRILSALNIDAPEGIEQRFGKPDSIEEAGPVRIYRYAGGRISLLWNTWEQKLNAVNVTR